LTYDVEIKWGSCGRQGPVRVKYHQAMYSGLRVIIRTSYIALSRNGEKSESPVL